VPDCELPEIIGRFATWKQSLIGESRPELTGHESTPNQLLGFCHKILSGGRGDVSITLAGADSRITAENYIERLRERASSSSLIGLQKLGAGVGKDAGSEFLTVAACCDGSCGISARA
jgi:hypothetical protein